MSTANEKLISDPGQLREVRPVINRGHLSSLETILFTYKLRHLLILLQKIEIKAFFPGKLGSIYHKLQCARPFELKKKKKPFLAFKPVERHISTEH